MDTLLVPNIFVQYFNDQLLDYYKLQDRHNPQKLASLLTGVTKLAILLTDGKLLIPTIDLVQSKPLNLAFPEIKEFLDCRIIEFVGHSVIVKDFLKHKHKHFNVVKLYPEYNEKKVEEKLERTNRYWTKRVQSTTQDIINRWKYVLSNLNPDKTGEGYENYDSHLLLQAYEQVEGKISVLKYIDEMYNIPERLDGQAFLWSLVETQKLTSFSDNQNATFPIELALGFGWLLSHIQEYHAVILNSIPPLGEVDCGISKARPHSTINYRVLASVLQNYRLLELIQELRDNQHIIELKFSETFNYFKTRIWLPRYLSITEASYQNLKTPLLLKERIVKDKINDIIDKHKKRSAWATICTVLECIVAEVYSQNIYLDDSYKVWTQRRGYIVDTKELMELAEKFVSELSPIVTQGVGEIAKTGFKDAYNAIKKRFSEKPESKAVVEKFEQQPTQTASALQTTLAEQLKKDAELVYLLVETLEKSGAIAPGSIVGRIENVEKVVVANKIDTLNM